MISFLSGIFIKNRDQTDLPEVRQAYGMLCGAVGIFLNLLLFTGKFAAGFLSNSIAITADAFNNLSDAGSSLLSLIGFKMAGQAPDPGHPFGHGRIEYITGFLISIIILVMGLELVKTSAEKIIRPETTEFSAVILVILVASILIKLYMFLYNRRYGRSFLSASMKATSMDSLSDMLATTVVLLAALFQHFTGIGIDGYCGLLVGLFILYAGFCAARDTLNPLLGQPPSPEFVGRIESILLDHPHILGIHDLIVHDYGPGRVMISVHAEVPASGNMLELHDTIDNIERELHTVLKCDTVIHMDPVMNDDEETQTLKLQVLQLLHELDSSLNLHDFRIVRGPTHTNIIFDILVPFGLKLTDNTVKAFMEDKIHSMNGAYYAVINVDKDFVHDHSE